jgi:hypothetical protein
MRNIMSNHHPFELSHQLGWRQINAGRGAALRSSGGSVAQGTMKVSYKTGPSLHFEIIQQAISLYLVELDGRSPSLWRSSRPRFGTLMPLRRGRPHHQI